MNEAYFISQLGDLALIVVRVGVIIGASAGIINTVVLIAAKGVLTNTNDRVARVEGSVGKLEITVDGRLTQLLEANKVASKAAGVLEGRAAIVSEAAAAAMTAHNPPDRAVEMP